MTELSDDAIGRLCAVANWPEFASERYTVTKEIGRGGMGTVYAAIDGALGREVALKVSNTVASAPFERRIAAEARALARLEHPGIVPVHDVGRLTDGRLFYVMKRVHGSTLREYLGHDSDLSERLRIFERVCEAVAFAHARRILHRDLKPDNVMIGAFGEVMVMDWGVAKSLSPDGVERTAGEDRPSGRASTRSRTHQPRDRGRDARIHGAGAGARRDGRPGRAGRRLRSRRHPSRPADEARNPDSARRPRARPSQADRVDSSTASVGVRPRAGGESGRSLPVSVGAGRRCRAISCRTSVHAHRETALERAGRVVKVYRTPIALVLAYMIMRALVAFGIGR